MGNVGPVVIHQCPGCMTQRLAHKDAVIWCTRCNIPYVKP